MNWFNWGLWCIVAFQASWNYHALKPRARTLWHDWKAREQTIATRREAFAQEAIQAEARQVVYAINKFATRAEIHMHVEKHPCPMCGLDWVRQQSIGIAHRGEIIYPTESLWRKPLGRPNDIQD